MECLELANQFIPGYVTLPEDVRSNFEQTEAGKALLKGIGPSKTIPLYRLLFQMITDSNLLYWDSLEDDIDEYRHQHGNSQDYLGIIDLVIQNQTEMTKRYIAALEVCEKHINMINHEHFNSNHRRLSLSKAFQQQDKWLKDFEQALQNYINTHLTLNVTAQPLAPLQDRVLGSLSSMFTSDSVQDNQQAISQFIKKLADAHAFIQATGFSTQNENSYLAILDMYNYSRTAEHIAEARFELARFLEPFSPLFAEYYDIAHHERNVAWQMFRTIMPMLIVCSVIVLVSALLTPFAIPELGFMLILIPTTYIGLALATSYVMTKNNIYHTLRQLYYNGQFEIPEYQSNQRMEIGFGTTEKASSVRHYYVNEIERCFNKEILFQQQPEAAFTEALIKERAQNKRRTGTLQLEWYDIHSNSGLGSDKISQIALNRMQLDYKDECISFTKKCPELARTITEETRARLENTGVAPQYRLRLFSPSCFDHKAKAENLEVLLRTLN